MKKKYLYSIILTLIFTFFIFYIKNVFFVFEDKLYVENKYMEESNDIKRIIEKEKIDYNKLKEKILELKEKEEELSAAKKVNFYYIPKEFKKEVVSYKDIIYSIVTSSVFNSKIISLWVEFYEVMIDVRGKMKSWKIKLFWVLNIEKPEFISLFIHELSHYIDLYYLERKVSFDLSNDFYNISWDTTKVMKKGQKSRDFVSGYAMTNKYEDFAESFTYFVLHNEDFLFKSTKSDFLKQKYDFFNKVLFKNKEFKETDFSPNLKVQDYYWDITKIDIKDENFLQFLKK